MRGLANRPWWLWVIGLMAIVTLATITRDRLLTSDSASTAAREGMLETADFTLPIPRGHRALSQTEVVELTRNDSPNRVFTNSSVHTSSSVPPISARRI